ncbi:hypothetical protein FM106_06060 [Brachybacterium faecium]|nr:hypothetical protein FM106_06060 [Brachybacterium faecium]
MKNIIHFTHLLSSISSNIKLVNIQNNLTFIECQTHGNR